jgi:hypothetical protein
MPGKRVRPRCRANKVSLTMSEIIERESARKADDAHVENDCDLDFAALIAARFCLQPHIARLVVRLAGLGPGGSTAA